MEKQYLLYISKLKAKLKATNKQIQQLNHFIGRLVDKNIELKQQVEYLRRYINSPLALYETIELLLDKDIYQDGQEFRLQQYPVSKAKEDKYTTLRKIHPKNIVFIISYDTGRRKLMVWKSEGGAYNTNIINDNKMDFETLLKIHDPLNRYLFQPNSSSIINFEYYDDYNDKSGEYLILRSAPDIDKHLEKVDTKKYKKLALSKTLPYKFQRLDGKYDNGDNKFRNIEWTTDKAYEYLKQHYHEQKILQKKQLHYIQLLQDKG
ncbi:MAG: hypothetical protein EBX41_08835 [Chitinophagia bacterium]|nr:hypothetical protein [Chitinophagia bacterium]